MHLLLPARTVQARTKLSLGKMTSNPTRGNGWCHALTLILESLIFETRRSLRQQWSWVPARACVKRNACNFGLIVADSSDKLMSIKPVQIALTIRQDQCPSENRALTFVAMLTKADNSLSIVATFFYRLLNHIRAGPIHEYCQGVKGQILLPQVNLKFQLLAARWCRITLKNALGDGTFQDKSYCNIDSWK